MLQEAASEANQTTFGDDNAGESPADVVDPSAAGTSEESETVSDSDGTPLSEEENASDESNIGELEVEEALDDENHD